MKNEKILYFENAPKVNDVKINLEYSQKLIQDAITEFNKIAVPITINELEGLFDKYRGVQNDKLEEFIKNKLVEGKEGSIGGLQLNTDRLKDLIVLPDLTELIAALDKFTAPIESESTFAPDIIYYNYFSIDKDNKVKIAKDAINNLTKGFREYAETPEQLSRLSDAKKLCSTLMEFIKLYPEINPVVICNSNLISFYNNEFIPNPSFVNYGRI